MNRRRIVTLIGLAVATGGLLVACTGAPAVNLPTTPMSFGVGGIVVQLPPLNPSVRAPVAVDRPLVNQTASVDASAPVQTTASTSQQAGASAESGIFSSGHCTFGD